MTLSELSNTCQRISKKIEQIGKANDSHYVIDGIIDPGKYLDSKLKILWVLKEANSESTTWSYIENFKNKDWLLTHGKKVPTLKRIIYTTYGILRDCQWSEIPDAKDEKSFEPLQEIALINIKKIPGSSIAKPSEIQAAYYTNQELVKEQIDTYDPDVVIFGNTLNYFDVSDFEGLENLEKQVSDFGNHFYKTDQRLYINTWHPAVRGFGFTDNGYIMDIVNLVHQWNKNR